MSFRLYKKLIFICQTHMAEIHLIEELGPAQDLTSTWPNMNLSAPKATLFSHLLRRVPCCQNTDMLHGITHWRLFVLFSCSLPTGVQTPGSYFEATLCQPLIHVAVTLWLARLLHNDAPELATVIKPSLSTDALNFFDEEVMQPP